MTLEPDPRVVRGTRGMLARQRRQVAAGAGRLGWKAAFGSSSGRELLGLDRPLVGFLTRDRELPAGATVSLRGWSRPMLEAEIAVHVGRDLPRCPDPDAVRKAVAGLSTAVELVDLDVPPTRVEDILDGNVYHRHVLTARPPVPGRDLADLTVTVLRDGVEVARTDDPQASTGAWLDVVTSMADTLGREGEVLLAGDVVITGAVVPPLEASSGQRWTVVATGLGELELTTD